MVQVVTILLMISGSSYGEFILEVISTKDLIDQANGIYSTRLGSLLSRKDEYTRYYQGSNNYPFWRDQTMQISRM